MGKLVWKNMSKGLMFINYGVYTHRKSKRLKSSVLE